MAPSPSTCVTMAAASNQPPGEAAGSRSSPTGSAPWGAAWRSIQPRRRGQPSPLSSPSPSGTTVAEDPMRVVIAEDNCLVREGTTRLLETTGEVEVVAAVGTAPEL